MPISGYYTISQFQAATNLYIKFKIVNLISRNLQTTIKPLKIYQLNSFSTIYQQVNNP